MADRKQFPIGVQDFASIRYNDIVYIDKVCLIDDLACKNDRYFFFRHRRFGKYLLLSTLRYYFEGRENLFEVLAFDSLEKESSEDKQYSKLFESDGSTIY